MVLGTSVPWKAFNCSFPHIKPMLQGHFFPSRLLKPYFPLVILKLVLVLTRKLWLAITRRVVLDYWTLLPPIQSLLAFRVQVVTSWLWLSSALAWTILIRSMPLLVERTGLCPIVMFTSMGDCCWSIAPSWLGNKLVILPEHLPFQTVKPTKKVKENGGREQKNVTLFLLHRLSFYKVGS